MNNMFSKRLKELRSERDVTLEEVSKITGISYPTLSRYETGHRDEPKLSIMRKLANYYNVSIDYLAGVTVIKDRDMTPSEIARIFSELKDEDKKLLMTLAKSLLRKEGKE